MDREDLTRRIHKLVNEVTDSSPDRVRSFLPISCMQDIQPGLSAMIVARPQVPFRGDRLAIWERCAADFFIEGIKVGTRAQGVQAGTIPADAFATRLDLLPVLDAELKEKGLVHVKISKKAEECFGQPLHLPKAQPGTDVTLYVTNAGDRPRKFVAVILGDADW
jgi:hypothetical protein